MTESDSSMLIIARAGPLQEGLSALMQAIPAISEVKSVSDPVSALEKMNEFRPSLILVGTHELDERVWTVLSHIKIQWPRIRCVVLAADGRERLSAEAIGADAVLPNGYPAAGLIATIEDLLRTSQC